MCISNCQTCMHLCICRGISLVDSLVPGRFLRNFQIRIFQSLMAEVIVLLWMSLYLIDKSTSVQVMAWCRQAPSHYLSQCWPRYMPPYGVTGPQWVKIITQLPQRWRLLHSVPCFNIKTIFSRYRIPITKIRQSRYHLTFIIGIPQTVNQYKECLSQKQNSHYEDMTMAGPYYLYNDNSYTSKIYIHIYALY